MSTWDLNRLRYTVRKITGKYDITQLPDGSNGENNMSNPPGIDDYINDFYLYDMPEDLRSLRLRNFYQFTTIPNCGTYAIPQNIIQIYDPVYVDNYQFAFYQDPNIFYRIWPELNFINQAISVTVSGQATYPFTLTQTPVQQGTVVIGLQPNQDGSPSPAFETFTDKDTPIPLDIPIQQKFTNPGTLTGSFGGTGTIDYLTGAVSITYASAPTNSGVNINAHYHPYVASRPRDIMVWQQQVFMRPIPNDVYAVKMMAYMLPTTVLSAATNATVRPSLSVAPGTTNSSAPAANTVTIQGFSGQSGSLPTDLPQFSEFWQLLAYGAALKIFAEDGEHEEYSRYTPYYEKAKLLVQRKTLKQLSQNRIQTQYAENVSGPSFPIFPIYANILTSFLLSGILVANQGVYLCESVGDVINQSWMLLLQCLINIAWIVGG